MRKADIARGSRVPLQCLETATKSCTPRMPIQSPDCSLSLPFLTIPTPAAPSPSGHPHLPGTITCQKVSPIQDKWLCVCQSDDVKLCPTCLRYAQPCAPSNCKEDGVTPIAPQHCCRNAGQQQLSQDKRRAQHFEVVCSRGYTDPALPSIASIWARLES